jgi:hypothetical protein
MPPIEELRKRSLSEAMKFLTEKEKMWIQVFKETHNASEAYRVAYQPNPDPRYSKYDSLQGHILKTRPLIALVLDKIESQDIITKESLIGELEDEIFVRSHDTITERTLKMKAIELAAKMNRYFDADKETSDRSNIQIVMRKGNRKHYEPKVRTVTDEINEIANPRPKKIEYLKEHETDTTNDNQDSTSLSPTASIGE